MPQIVPLIEAQVKEMCRQRGFVTKGYFYAKKLHSGFWGLVGIGYATYSYGRSIDVCLGIFSDEIYTLVKKIWTIADPKAYFWLILPNIGWLNASNPQREVWYVDDDTNLSDVCTSIFDKIDAVSPWFFDKYSDIDVLINVYENYRNQPWPICHDDAYRTLPFLYLANNQKGKGLEYILKHLSSHEILTQYDILYAENYDSLFGEPQLINIHIGDIFSVITDSGDKRFFQFIAKDTTQYNSDVIRVFKQTYSKEDNPTAEDFLEGAVECYMHTMVSWGLYLGLWTRSGSDGNIGRMDISFRRSKDYGRFPMFEKRVSNNWEVWTINQPKQNVGKLPESHYSADIGEIGSPPMFLKRINEGYFPSEWYPLYKEQE